MTPQLVMLLVLGGGAASLFLLFALFWNNEPGGSAFNRRLARVGGDFVIARGTKAPSQTLRRRTADSNFPLFDKLIKTTLPNPDKLRTRLARTGKNMTLGEYLMLNALLILVFFLIFAYLLHWTKIIAVFLAVAAGLFLPHLVTGKMAARRLRKFLASFPEAIDTICRGLRAGLPITESIATVGNELPDPVGIEFRRISDSVRVGRSLDESLWDVEKRLDTPEFRFFIIALAIQRETGGNLAETLGNLADLLRRRRQLKLKIRAMSSEARASAMIIGSLPFLMFGLLMAVNSEYMMVLLTVPLGKFLLGCAIGWLSLGVFVMKQMIAFEI
ncbi:MAG: type II secretion system F family protein [Alphaproteobacteria bacterium]|nr:type II secretion system F family protein [Alphaproteobacteria bacterium]